MTQRLPRSLASAKIRIEGYYDFLYEEYMEHVAKTIDDAIRYRAKVPPLGEAYCSVEAPLVFHRFSPPHKHPNVRKLRERCLRMLSELGWGVRAAFDSYGNEVRWELGDPEYPDFNLL